MSGVQQLLDALQVGPTPQRAATGTMHLEQLPNAADRCCVGLARECSRPRPSDQSADCKTPACHRPCITMPIRPSKTKPTSGWSSGSSPRTPGRSATMCCTTATWGWRRTTSAHRRCAPRWVWLLAGEAERGEAVRREREERAGQLGRASLAGGQVFCQTRRG